MSGPTRDPIATTLRQLDRERYLATLILPEPARRDVQALYAALAEIAAVSERVNEPMAGEIRLTWWTELLAGDMRGDAESNPVAIALMETVKRHNLPVQPLVDLIAARRFDLYSDPMPDMTQFEGYAGDTVSVPLQLAAMITHAGAARLSADTAGHLGVALALFGHLSAFGFNAARGRIFLPLSVFAAHGVSEHDILSRKNSPSLRAALDQIADMAREHLSRARDGLHRLPRDVRPAFAQIAMIDARARGRADPFAPPRPRAGWGALARLMWFGAVLK